MATFTFNAPPGWPPAPAGWTPPEGWMPDPSWPPAPPGWDFWTEETPADGGGRHAAPAPEDADVAPTSDVDATPQPVEAVADSAVDNPAPEIPVVADISDAVQEIPDADLADRRAELDRLELQIAQARAKLESLTAPTTVAIQAGGAVVLDDAAVMQEVGIYQYHHPLENAQQYKDRLKQIQGDIKDAVREGRAVLASDMFAYNNSLAQGRKMTADFSKLMLRTYNAEADNAIRSLRAGAVQVAIRRLEASMETVARLGSMMEMRIDPNYHALRIKEVELTADHHMKVQAEREAAREERADLREQERAARELEREQEKLLKEREHYAAVLQSMRAQGKTDEADALETQIETIDTAIERNDYRIANIRAGYVYVISNIGAFGRGVVKIGMTRRLKPMDRVTELGDASVPFPFDVHALYFADDAVTLENELHKEFADRRVNHVNLRREFFFATPAEVETAMETRISNLLEFTEEPIAEQYFQSRQSWPTPALTEPGR